MTYTNTEIYEYAQQLAFFSFQGVLPVRINFYMQKNIQIIQQAAMEIDNARMAIGAQFGSLNSELNGYDISPENIDNANRELQDLFALKQTLPIHIFKLSDFDGIELTYQQMSAIMFMIEED